MAKDTYSNKSRKTQKDIDQSPVYKIMGAVVLLVVSVYLMRLVANNYSTIYGFDVVYSITKIAAIGFGALAVLALAALFAVKDARVHAWCPYVVAIAALYALTALVLRLTWMDYVDALTFLHVAVCCLYIVWMLYGSEFFLVSLVTVVAGATFYRYSRGIGASFSCITLGALLVLLSAAAAYLGANAAAHKGRVQLGKKRWPLFSSRFNPLGIYITCAVWLVCLLACLIFGAGFAYYCMFAAIAYELIAAVYYTFQLR